MNITEFLEARIAEDEAEAGSGWSTLGDTRWERDNYGRTMLTPSAVLAECAAKRAIIAECRPGTLDDLDSGEDDQPAPMWVARALAAVYKDRPDYQQEWAL
jgi:hypothetical protein